MSLERHFKKGKFHGKLIDYYENGLVKSMEHYKNGTLDGKQSEYYSNGTYKVIEYYRRGKRINEREDYYENGQLSLVCEYKRGLPKDWKSFNQNGEIDAYGTYKKDEKIILFNRNNDSELK